MQPDLSDCVRSEQKALDRVGDDTDHEGSEAAGESQGGDDGIEHVLLLVKSPIVDRWDV